MVFCKLYVRKKRQKTKKYKKKNIIIMGVIETCVLDLLL